MTYTFNYQFAGKKYTSTIEAQSQYAAQIKFNEFVLSRITIESITEKDSKQDPSVEFLKGIFGMLSLLFVVFFSSCSNNLAQKCSTKYPCLPTKEVVTKIEVKTDTILKWSEIPALPLVGVRCFQWENEKSIEIFKIPCTAINEQKTVYLTSYILDTAKILVLSNELSRLQKDSLKTAQKLVEAKSEYSKYVTFWKYSFIWTWFILVLLIGFYIFRKTKKALPY